MEEDYAEDFADEYEDDEDDSCDASSGDEKAAEQISDIRANRSEPNADESSLPVERNSHASSSSCPDSSGIFSCNIETERSVLSDRVESLSAGDAECSGTKDIRDKLSKARQIKSAVNGDNVQNKLHDVSRGLVNEREKHLKMVLQLETTKDELANAKSEIAVFRRLLLQGINGGITDATNYSHVPLDELLRLRLKETVSINRSNASSFSPTKSVVSRMVHADDTGTFSGIKKLERNFASLKGQNAVLRAKCAELDEALQKASKGADEVGPLKKKIAHLVERSRYSKEVGDRKGKELIDTKKKVEGLSEHIDKLQIRLEHEVTSKATISVELARTQRENEHLQEAHEVMVKKNARKDRAITELKEGGKMLEDQLRLMDTKHHELQRKMALSRNCNGKAIKRKDDELRHIHEKFALMSHLTPEKKGSQGSTSTWHNWTAMEEDKNNHASPAIVRR